MSRILDDLLRASLEGQILKVVIGLHWTAVVAETDSGLCCGLASTLSSPNHHHGSPDVAQAGQLEDLPGSILAALAQSDMPIIAGVGVAAINTLLPRNPRAWIDLNAEEVLAACGSRKKVALVGHFPFIPRLHERVGELLVLEQNPQPGDMPAAAAVDVLPEADVVAITGTSLINHTLDNLLDYCSSNAVVVLLGPSTPLSPSLFDHGIDILCGSIVTDIEPVLRSVSQGANFRQVRRAGVRTVTMTRSGHNDLIDIID